MFSRPWLSLWSAWGAVVGAVVWYADGAPWAGAGWLAAGVLVGSVGWWLLCLLPVPSGAWFWNRAALPRVARAERHGREDDVAQVEDFLDGLLDMASLPVPAVTPLGRAVESGAVALVFGPAVGSLAGCALAALAAAPGLSATRGAALGALFGPAAFAALTLAGYVSRPRPKPRPSPQPLRPLVNQAAGEARRLGCRDLGVEHLLLAVGQDEGGRAAGLLQEWGVSPEWLRAAVARRVAPGADPAEREPGAWAYRALTLAKLLRAASREAGGRGDPQVRAEHLLLALLEEPTGVVKDVLADVGVRGEALRRVLTEKLAPGG